VSDLTTRKRLNAMLIVLGDSISITSDSTLFSLKKVLHAIPDLMSSNDSDFTPIELMLSSPTKLFTVAIQIKAILFQLQPSTESDYFYDELIIEVLNQLSYSILTNNTLTQHEQNAWVTIISFPKINETLQKSAIDLINKTNFTQATTLAQSEDEHHIVALQVSEQKKRAKTQK